MHRNVYLQGELAERFGDSFRVQATSCAEILKCINANRPTFSQYLRECHEQDIAIAIKCGEEGKNLENEDISTELKEGDVYMAIIPAGSKSGLGKILAAVALITIGLPMLSGGLGTAAAVGPNMTWGAMIQAGAGTTLGKIAVGLATNLAITGLMQIMAPDPEKDVNSTNYLFDGDSQNMEEGDPVPILYGELRVPGRPISLNVINGSYINPTSILEADGSISAASLTPESPVGA